MLALQNAMQLEGMYLGIDKASGWSLRNAGELLLFGGANHRTGENRNGGKYRQLREKSQELWPDSREIAHWSAQDCMTLDGVPYIGNFSENTPHWYVATGFQKWGMTSSMVSAMILTDLVQGKKNPYEEVFSPSRSILHPQLAVNGFEAMVSLLTPTTKRCPHLGCALKWNPVEHTWDCPCHGSRFTEAGKLIDNPATGNLKK